MSRSLPNSVVAGTIVAVVTGLSLITYWAYHRHNSKPLAIEGRPLLASETVFVDPQLGWSFTPPAGWAMQARSMDSPDNPRPERMIVKYKQFIEGQPAAWLRISVAENSKGMSPSDLLRERKPPEANWKRVKDVEGDVVINSQKAARVSFTGQFDTDGRGNKDYACEVLALIHKNRVFYFTGFFPTGDTKSLQRINDAIATVKFN